MNVAFLMDSLGGFTYDGRLVLQGSVYTDNQAIGVFGTSAEVAFDATEEEMVAALRTSVMQ